MSLAMARHRVAVGDDSPSIRCSPWTTAAIAAAWVRDRRRWRAPTGSAAGRWRTRRLVLAGDRCATSRTPQAWPASFHRTASTNAQVTRRHSPPSPSMEATTPVASATSNSIAALARSRPMVGSGSQRTRSSSRSTRSYKTHNPPRHQRELRHDTEADNRTTVNAAKADDSEARRRCLVPPQCPGAGAA